MNTKKKIYMRFLGCFLVCALFYLFSTYLKDFTQNLFKNGTQFGVMEFVLITFMSLQNGIILEKLNKTIFRQPEKIFTMLNYLILQLYLFSMILFYIVLVINNIFVSNSILTENILEINALIFVGYILYLWYGKKKKHEKCGRMEGVKAFIGASIIFQSSIIELGFLSLYLLLLHFFTQTEVQFKLKPMFLLRIGVVSIVLMEIGILISALDWIGKLVFSVTNIFIVYVGKQDQKYINKQKRN